MGTHRFGRKLKLPSTFAIKHQVLVRMLHEAIEKERAEAYEQAKSVRRNQFGAEPNRAA